MIHRNVENLHPIQERRRQLEHQSLCGHLMDILQAPTYHLLTQRLDTISKSITYALWRKDTVRHHHQFMMSACNLYYP